MKRSRESDPAPQEDAVIKRKKVKVKLNTIEKSTPKSQPDSKLLNLPPELRNQIFEYCLKAEHLSNTGITTVIEGNLRIEITENLNMPALIATCQQLRQETFKIWLFANEFHIIIQDCNAAILLAWHAFCRKVKQQHGKQPETTIGLSGEPDWQNLKSWCKAVWSRKVMAIEGIPGGSDHRTILAAQNIAKQSRSLPWEKCEAILEYFRIVAGDANSLWLYEDAEE